MNNPFRQQKSEMTKNLSLKEKEWGKVKFKPTLRKSTDTVDTVNRGGKPRKFGHPDKDTVQFSSHTTRVRTEEATPWATFKEEILQKQCEEEQKRNGLDMDCEEAQNCLRQREINYRKMIIQQKQDEPTIWEDFDDSKADTKEKGQKDGKHRSHYNKEKSNKIQKESFKRQGNRFKNKLLEENKKEFISDELLKNFDSKKLNFTQNNTLRRFITKSTTLAYGTKFEQIVEDMKRQKEIKKNIK